MPPSKPELDTSDSPNPRARIAGAGKSRTSTPSAGSKLDESTLKPISAASSGTFPTTSGRFALLVFNVVVDPEVVTFSTMTSAPDGAPSVGGTATMSPLAMVLADDGADFNTTSPDFTSIFETLDASASVNGRASSEISTLSFLIVTFTAFDDTAGAPFAEGVYARY